MTMDLWRLSTPELRRRLRLLQANVALLVGALVALLAASWQLAHDHVLAFWIWFGLMAVLRFAALECELRAKRSPGSSPCD